MAADTKRVHGTDVGSMDGVLSVLQRGTIYLLLVGVEILMLKL